MQKVFELRIEEDDELSGVDAISLVDEPAIEINWVAFSKEREEFIIPDGEDDKYYTMLSSIAESEEEMLNDGWVIDKVEVFGKEKFTNPNATSELDTEEVRVRYKYALHPDIKENSVIPTTRDFCRNLVSKNQVWRTEDFFSLTNDQGSSAFVWRGGYNCRHVWQKITYKKTGDIVNKASVNKNKTTSGDFPSSMTNPEYDILGIPQPSTLTGAARDSRNPSTIKNLATRQGPYVGMSKEKFSLPLFEKKEDAEDYAKLIGCSGSHPHNYGDVTLYMPCEKHPEDMGYDNTLPPFVDEVPKTGKTENFSTDDEKRIVVGPAMIPDLNIVRRDAFGKPYYVYFTSETIKIIAEKYMKNKYIDNNDTNHNGEAAKDVYVIESWIKEDDLDKSVKYGFGDLPVGTWFVAMKVKNDEVWNKVKNGELNGFSVSGYFEEIAEFARERMFLVELAKYLETVKD